MQIKRDLEAVKYSVRSTFRSLTISCKPNTPLLCLQFIKEKRKDKMLQKLGMKKGQVPFFKSINLFSFSQNEFKRYLVSIFKCFPAFFSEE